MGFPRYTEEIESTIRGWTGILAAPMPQNRKKNRITVLQNPFLEKWFATAHPLTPGVWFLPLIAWGLYVGLTSPVLSWASVGGWFALGVMLWTLLEYGLHRFFFHMDPGTTYETRLRSFMVHGYHHEFPNDKLRLVAPPLMSWSLGLIISAIYFPLFGSDRWLVVFAGTAVGYLAYDWTHYYTHHFRPTTRLGQFLRRYHMEHHFKDPTTHYGISNPLWDIVFGTYSKPELQEFPDEVGYGALEAREDKSRERVA